MTGETDEVQYLVLPDVTNAYFLARVRWPDVCQAISPVRPYWQDDPGLFDLPYDPNSTPVTFDQAAAIAATWNVRLPADGVAAPAGPSIMRRMPADWSNLSRAEKRAWSIEFMRTRKDAARSEDAPSRDVAQTRRGRWRLRRRAVRPELAPVELPSEELIPELAAASADPVEVGSMLVLDEEPVLVAGGSAGPARNGDDVVIDLTDTSEDAAAGLDGA